MQCLEHRRCVNNVGYRVHRYILPDTVYFGPNYKVIRLYGSLAYLNCRAAKQADFLLLSHGDILHLGLVVYAYKQGMNCPIYATLPVANMGRQALIDAVNSKILTEEFDMFTKQDIDDVFNKIVKLKYSESVALAGKCFGIVITPFPAGHSLGGTIWRIKKDTDDIIYAINYNHRRERHLNATVLESFTKPSVVITDAYNGNNVQISRNKRDSELLDTLLSTLRGDGNVLIPVDSSLRVLELAHLMDQLWSYQQLSFPLLLLTTNAVQTIEFARSMLEWMGEAAIKHFSNTRETPFDFKCLRLCQSVADVEKYPQPRVVLASLNSLDSGMAKDLFVSTCDNDKNVVLLVDRSYPDSLSRTLYNMFCNTSALTRSRSVSVKVQKRVPLEGEELEAYQRVEHEKQQKHYLEELLNERKRKLIEEEVDETNENELADEDDQLLFFGDKYDYFTKQQDQRQNALAFFANEQKTVCYPSTEHKRSKVDEYGEEVSEEDFVNKHFEQAKLDYLKGDTLSMMAQHEMNAYIDPVDEYLAARPTKCVSYDLNLDVLCQVKFIDFEGLSDGKSVKTILQHIQPKKLILIRGTEEATNSIVDFLTEREFIEDDIIVPKVGELVNISAATNIYQIKMTDSLMSSLKFSRVNDYELAFLGGRVMYEEDSDVPVLDILPAAEKWKGHDPITVGDTKLTELKRILTNIGIHADFDRGALIVGLSREIRVQRTEKGLMLEGPFTPDFYKIRKYIYRLNAIL